MEKAEYVVSCAFLYHEGLVTWKCPQRSHRGHWFTGKICYCYYNYGTEIYTAPKAKTSLH